MSKDKADGQESEQSMEDILASIRKIISDDDEPEGSSGSSSGCDEDDEDASGAYSAGDDGDADDAGDDDDILELSDPLPDEEPEAVAASASSAAAPAMEDDDSDASDLLVMEDADEEAASSAASAEPETEAETNVGVADAEADDDDEFGLVFEDAPEEPEPEPEVEVNEEPVLAEQPMDQAQSGLLSAEAAALSAGALASLRSGDAITGAMGIGRGDTVEGLVAELLKPMLKQWLDIHLPSMVENLVREEIQRIQRQDKD